jgi:thymidylate synthase
MQRSVDVFVGMPFNIAGYGILTHFLAHITNHMPSMMSHYGCDVHIYADHAEGLKEFGQREIPVDSKPIVLFPDTWRELNDFRWEDVVIDGYKPLLDQGAGGGMSARRTHILVELDGVLADGQHRSKRKSWTTSNS